MKKVIIFSGTTEGRVLAGHLSESDFESHIFVATEYGQTVSPKGKNIIVRAGRLDEKAMCDTFRALQPYCIIDATHPYATDVSKNIANAAASCDMEVIRLLREEPDEISSLESDEDITIVPDIVSAARMAEELEGNIFVSTGSKELCAFVREISDKDRIYARILPAKESMDIACESGLDAGHIIAMKGPFSEKMNIEMFKATQSRILITKDGGKTGGFAEKIQAAGTLLMKTVIIKRPPETGLYMRQVCEKLGVPMEGKPEKSCEKKARINVVGIGVGSGYEMTESARRAIAGADAIIGAARMIDAVTSSGIASQYSNMVTEYDGDKIRSLIDENPQWRRIAIVVSGDVGFYSGARSIGKKLEGEDTEFIPGISSVLYFCSKIKLPWEDMTFVSCHGRKNSILNRIAKNRKVFAIFSDASQIKEVAAGLFESRFGNVKMYVGCNLSYEAERIFSGRPADFKSFGINGLAVAVFINDEADTGVSYGLADSSFERGRVPMTKEEVRAVSLSKLSLHRDSVLWDIGAGTGSISVEAARMCDTGHVYAIEKNDEAADLIRKNAKKFCLDNLDVIKGTAPDALPCGMLPMTHAFIGGSSGNLGEIIDVVLQANPHSKVVINTVTLESLTECILALKKHNITDADIVTINISKNRKIGEYNMMNAGNPVTVITFEGHGIKSTEGGDVK